MKHIKELIELGTGARREWTWIPKRMASGSVVWFNYYYVEEQYLSVEPRHRWIIETLYTEKEWFLKRLSK